MIKRPAQQEGYIPTLMSGFLLFGKKCKEIHSRFVSSIFHNQKEIMLTKQHTHECGGFALLLTLIVVSVVIALGLSLVDISLRQLNLSGISRDSEIAFHAAYMGSECAEYSVRSRSNRAKYYTQSRGGGLLQNNRCVVGGSRSHSYNEIATDVHENSYQITWSDTAGTDRCTEIDIYVMDAENAGRDLIYDFGGASGYKAKSCADGRLCTLIFSRGYNRACSDYGTQRTIQREVVTEF